MYRNVRISELETSKVFASTRSCFTLRVQRGPVFGLRKQNALTLSLKRPLFSESRVNNNIISYGSNVKPASVDMLQKRVASISEDISSDLDHSSEDDYLKDVDQTIDFANQHDPGVGNRYYEWYGRKHTYKLDLTYDGTKYCGWQIQPGLDTIQGRVEKALISVTGLDRRVLGVTGAGRTDSGVHAHAQVVSFYTKDAKRAEVFVRALNGHLPMDIRARKVIEVARDFHARFSAINKTYHYMVHHDPVLDPFTERFRFHQWSKLNVEAMREGASYFVGTHDFTAFANNTRAPYTREPVRTIKRFDIVDIERGLRFEVESSGFLYKQVRNMVGALLRLGSVKGNMEPEDIKRLLKSKDRKQVPPGARALGLFLASVEYPPSHEDPTGLMHHEASSRSSVYAKVSDDVELLVNR